MEWGVASLDEPDAEAIALWNDASAAGDHVRSYLRSRGISLDIPSALREGLRTEMGGGPIPTMVAAVHGPDGRVIATQSTILTSSRRKALGASPKATTGRLGAGAVRLGPASEVLGISEGIETALSAMELFGMSVWASLGGQRLGELYIPPEVRELHIFGDMDRAGQLAAALATGHYTRQGLRVELRWPPEPYQDFNDLLQAKSRQVDP
jgi:hypothetical protein